MFLKMSAKSQDTIVQWGVYAGKYRILSGMPIIVVTSICASLVPAMSVSNASMNIGRLKEKAQLLIRLSVLLALPAAAFFAIMADTLMPVSYTHLDVYKRQAKPCAKGADPAQGGRTHGTLYQAGRLFDRSGHRR